jgi:CRISPR system Cascade subunit CasE
VYFSRVRLDPSTRGSSELIRALHEDAYAAHRLIWRAFPADPERERDFLFRQEVEAEQLRDGKLHTRAPLFYVVSARPPTGRPGFLAVEVKEFDPVIRAGERFAFDLRVNPVVTRPVEGKSRSTRHDVLMDAKRRARSQDISDPGRLAEIRENAVRDWFSRRCSVLGCRVPGEEDGAILEVSGYRRHVLAKQGRKPIQFCSVDIAGVIEVTDPDKFRAGLFRGIGPAKSFGCGLLLIRRH